MTAAEKRRILKSYAAAKAETDRLLEEIDRVKSSALARGISYDGMPKGSGTNDLSAWAAKWDELERRLYDAYSREAEAIRRIEEGIEAVPDSRERTVLRARYMSGMRIERIAEEMNLAVETTWKIHRKGIMHIWPNVNVP